MISSSSFTAFSFAKVPPIHFGAGKLQLLPKLIQQSGGSHTLLVTGGRSLEVSGQLQAVIAGLDALGIRCDRIICKGEPTPALIDEACATYRPTSVDNVVAIGGGSVVDAGKAISAMLPHDSSVLDYLEGVGLGIPHSGVKLPFIAIPTTSGTGSEMTKNAVISQVGPQGFKKSIRHDNLVPDAVIVDSHLLVTCPPETTAACGMDALTQLIEPYLSPTASPLSDAIAWSGLEAIVPNLLSACGAGANQFAVREAMAYGSMMSGIALANAGLGIVHGLASPLGAYYPIPHGVVCGTLMAAAVEANWKALLARAPESPAIEKMARLGTLLLGQPQTGQISPLEASEALVQILKDWTVQLQIPKLGQYGVTSDSLGKILAETHNRNNPVELSTDEVRSLLASRL